MHMFNGHKITGVIAYLLQAVRQFTKKPSNVCLRRQAIVKEGTVCKELNTVMLLCTHHIA